MNLDGIIIVTGENCPPCDKLKNMMNRAGIKYREKTQQELAKMKITSVPAILIDGVPVRKNGKIYSGCPGSLKDLKIILRR